MAVVPIVTGISRTPVLILAGGEGQRLHPLTRSRPKPLLALGPLRIVDFTLLNCQRSGLVDVSLLTQYKYEQIAGHVRQIWDGRFPCLPSIPGRRYRGTADAVFQNLPMVLERKTRDVLVLSGDHVYRMDYRKLIRRHVESNADVTVASVAYPSAQASSLGVIEVDRRDRVISFQEKPPTPRLAPGRRNLSLVSMGGYVFRIPALVEVLHQICGRGLGYDFGLNVLPALVRSEYVGAYEFRDDTLDTPGYWHDVGTIDSYYRVAMELARPNAPFRMNHLGVGASRDTIPLTRLSGGARVCRSMLCSGVRVDDDADVEDSLLMPGARVGHHARLRRAIVDEGVELPPNFTVGCDPEQDRAYHTVSSQGVVVVTDSAGSSPTRPPYETTVVPDMTNPEIASVD